MVQTVPGGLHPELLGRRLAKGWLLLLQEVCVTGQPHLGPNCIDDSGVDKPCAVMEGVGRERRGGGKATLLTENGTGCLMKTIPAPLIFIAHLTFMLQAFIGFLGTFWLGVGLSVPPGPIRSPCITRQTFMLNSPVLAVGPGSRCSCSYFITNRAAQHNGDIGWSQYQHYYLEEAKLFKHE